MSGRMTRWKLLRWLAVLLVFVAVAVGWWLTRRKVPEPASSIGGRVELAAGLVEQRRGERFEPVGSGMPLSESAALRTGPGARTLLRLVGGAQAFVDEATALALDGAGVSLDKGRIWLDVPASPQAVLHSAGDVTVSAADSGLSLSRDEKGVVIYVARGLAVVASKGGRREVAAGEQAVVDAAGALAVSAVAFWDDWTGGMADHGFSGAAGAGAGRLYAVDRSAAPGARSLPLEVKRQSVHARIADGVAETEVDQTFFNPSDRPVEGWYWFTVPDGALVTGFSLETNGALIAGEVVEKKEAAAKYEAAVEAAFDPALLEWIDGRSYRARIFPVPALGTRRVVLKYLELAGTADGTLRYLYPMAQTSSTETAIGEFALSVTLESKKRGLRISTLPDARVEDDGHRVTMRRSVYTPRADFQLEAIPAEPPEPLRVTRFNAGGESADYVMLRYVPDLDWTTVKSGPAEIVLAVDTSASGDEADGQLKAQVAEAILRSLSSEDKFALLTADMAPHVVFPEAEGDGLATATPANVARAIERLAERSSGGATDLASIFDPGLRRLHAAEQPALVYIGDGRPTSGEIRGLEVVERLRRALEGSRARFFTVSVGSAAHHSLLERLAAVGGGVAFRVDAEEEAVAQALRLSSAVKTPTLTELTLDVGVGLDEPLSNVTGKIARGQEMILLARTHHDLPATARVHGRIGGQPFDREHRISLADGAATPMVPLLWAAEFTRRLLGNAERADTARGKVVSLGLDYGLVTPFSSILALESEAAYGRMGIERRKRPWGRLAAYEGPPVEPGVLTQIAAVALTPLALTGCNSGPQENAPTVTAAPSQVPLEDLFKGLKEEEAAAKSGEEEGKMGKMGKRDSDDKNQRWAIKGPLDQAEIQVAKDRAKMEALRLADLAFKDLEGGVSTVWGTQERDAVSALGDRFGDKTGEASGYGGFGVAGSGRGGGGFGESSIGVGNIGTMGRGGAGYGRGVSRYGERSGNIPQVTPGKPIVSGALDTETIRRTIRQHAAEYKYCYEKQLNVVRDLAGKVTMKFTISGNGSVIAAAVEESTMGDREVENCLVAKIKRWVFPEPKGGGIVIVKYPFVFSCGGNCTAEPRPAPAPPVIARPRPLPRFPCSDLSGRPLPERVVLWARRLGTTESAAEALSHYDSAHDHCELPAWRDRRAFLGLIDRTVRSADAAEQVMQRFAAEPDALAYLGRRILRRNLDPFITAAVERHLKGGHIDWAAIDLELAGLPNDEARVERLRELLRATPGDVSGEIRLVRWLERAGRRPEALTLARRLRDRGLMSPALIRRYGDLMVAMGQADEALRAYSEIVEFDADSAPAHRLVGDLLLGHGWYDAAYREFRTLTEMTPTDAAGQIRLALAAAGAGRTDEALRLLRAVAEGDGKPGADDPRVHARIISGAIIARLMAAAPDAAAKDSLIRRLKQLQLLNGPGRLVILTWETLDASLGIGEASADAIDAVDVGLFAFRGPELAFGLLAKAIAVRSERLDGQERTLAYQLHEIVWDGKAFTVKVVPGTIAG